MECVRRGVEAGNNVEIQIFTFLFELLKIAFSSYQLPYLVVFAYSGQVKSLAEIKKQAEIKQKM